MADLNMFGLDVGIYGPLADPETVMGLAHFAEDVGFDSIWLADHVAFPASFESKYPFSAAGNFPAPTNDPLFEPLAVMGILVGATTKIKLGTAVLIIPYRNPVLTARMLITLDQFSGGRIVLGAGVGWLREEFEALQTPDFKLRGKATDEYLDIFKAMCEGGEIGFEGQTYRFDPVQSVPGSFQKPHPPILIGGVSDPALRRIVRRGDGWLATALGREEMPERLAALRSISEAEGRNFSDIQLVYKLFLSPGEAKQGPFGGRDMGSGSEADIIDDLKSVIDAGFEKIIIRYRGADAEEQTRNLARFAEIIAPAL